MIAQSTIEAVQQRANIVEIVSQYVTLKRQGSNYVGLCPFHTEKSPSFSVRDEGSFYHCFGCSASGNAIGFLMRMEGISFPDAVERIAGMYGIDVIREGGGPQVPSRNDGKRIYEINQMAQQFFRSSLKKSISQLEKYLRGRKIDGESIKHFGLGFAPSSWDRLTSELTSKGVSEEELILSGLARRSSAGKLYDTFRGRLIFPVHVERNKIAGFGGRVLPDLFPPDELSTIPKYLNSPETPIYHKHKILYGLPRAMAPIRQSSEVLLVEGYMDVLSLWRVGVRNVVATCGTALTPNHVERLSRVCQRVTVLFDGDTAGRNAAAKSFTTFLNSGLDAQIVFLPSDQDPDSISTGHEAGTAEYLQSLERHSPLSIYIQFLAQRHGYKSLSEVGAGAKGRISDEVAQQLRSVENEIERKELVKEAEFLLMIDPGSLGKQLESLSARPGRVHVVASRSESEAETPEESTTSKPIPNISELPRVDQTLLLSVMGLRGRFENKILNDPELSIEISDTTRRFVEQFGAIVSTPATSEADQLQQKERIASLLRSFGPSWVAHWRRSYRMLESGAVDFEKSYEECCLALSRDRWKRILNEKEREIRSCRSEDEKMALLQEKIDIERKVRGLAVGAA